MLARSFLNRLTKNGPVIGTRALSQGAGAGYNFELTDDQKAFQQLARTFAQDEIIPVAAKYDKSMAFPHDVFEKAWKVGLVNAHIPQQFGGLGLHTVRMTTLASLFPSIDLSISLSLVD
jgi:alkylation response protein AidB-like acyl-CoA dehydrogenase